MTDKFADVLDMPAEDIKPPKQLPMGEYIFLIEGQPELKDVERDTGSVKVATYQCRPLQPMGSVDMEALGEYGWPTDRKQRLEFWLAEESLQRFKDFVNNTLGKDTTGMTVRQMLAAGAGGQFIGTIKHVPSKDGQRFFANITSTAKV